EMVAGRQAFGGRTATETMDQILHSEPEPIASVRANAPPELERIIRKCLEKNREKRYVLTKGLQMELLQLKELVAFRGLPQAGVQAGVRPKRLLWIASAGALLVILLLLGIWFLRRAGTGVPGSAANPNEFTVTQITSDPGLVEDSSL